MITFSFREDKKSVDVVAEGKVEIDEKEIKSYEEYRKEEEFKILKGKIYEALCDKIDLSTKYYYYGYPPHYTYFKTCLERLAEVLAKEAKIEGVRK